MEFLYRVYASTREEELAVVPWNAEEKETFLRMQFNAQHQHYQQHFPDAAYSVILVDDTPAGRVYLHRRSDEIRIVDIALLPDYRSKGIGSELLSDILAEGKQTNLPVRIHVERFNPALRLYERLGFQQIGDQGVYYLMEWRSYKTQDLTGFRKPVRSANE
jgi:ribosomal protein S18 acetylase RimI-like enzyme